MGNRSFEEVSHLEANTGSTAPLDSARIASGDIDRRARSALPVVQGRFANPAPLGILSLATSVFLISCFGLKVRGVTNPNVMIGVLIFFGGVCQFISGIMEFVSGNTFGATIFPSYGAFNMAYGMIYLPGTGILAAYVDKSTGELSSSFEQAVAVYLWAWFILSVAFTVASIRSSWILLADFVVLDLLLMFLACGHMLGNQALQTVGYALGYVMVFLSYWVGIAGLYANGITPFTVPVFSRYKENRGQ